MHVKDQAGAKVEIAKDGPYLLSGEIPMHKQTIGTNAAGESMKWIEGEAFRTRAQTALCRCGHSKRKPYCDNSHAKAGFDGTETASREPYQSQAKVMRGPAMSLSDAESLCAFARFCDPHGQVWGLVDQTDQPTSRQHFVREAGDCPSGRLVAWDNSTGKPVEPEFAPSLGLIEDPANACSGPLWLRGGIPVIGADGFAYEVRNRVTLCRCGASKNKPFCDGTHAAVKFNDGL
jgi:CDGSH-type Zn-finger protein